MQSPWVAVVFEKRRVAALLLLSMIASLTCCAHRPLYPPKLTPEERTALLSGLPNIPRTGSSLAPSTNRTVRIFAQPVQLPQTDVGWQQHEYSFYIWASHPAYPGVGIRALRDLGLLELDIVGAPLRPRVAQPGDKNKAVADLQQQGLSALASIDAVENGQVLELIVRAGEIRGPIRIAAWFPSEYRMAIASQSADSTEAHEATWGDQVFVSIRSGDLTTKIEIVDQIEARAAFGDEFPRHFYVGRVFLQNTNSTKKLIVYTTSMRAPVYLYRRTDDEVTKRSPAPTATGQSKRPGKLPKIKSPPPSAPADTPNSSGNKPATSGPVPADPAFVHKPAAVMAQLLADIQAFAAKSTEMALSTPDAKLTSVRANLKTWLTTEREKALPSRRDALTAEIEKAPTAPAIEKSTNEAVAKQVETAWTALLKGTPPIAETLATFSTAAGKLGSAEADPLLVKARHLADQHTQRADLEAQIAYLKGTPTPDRSLALRLLARALSAGIFDFAHPASPFSDTPGLSVGLIDKTSPLIADQRQAQRVLFSQDASTQKQLDHFGYLWRDSSRPLTFQAVLNSLILTQNQANRTKWARGFELAGRVAGGLVALSPLVEEFGRQGWTRSVAFYSSVLSPELSGLLLEDLQAHITNLGALSMDTVMVVQPRSVVDRYVFFPRGPIFNHPDEFDQHSPAYIVKVIGDDVSVRAELVETTDDIDGEGAASALVQEARNTGTASAASALARQAQTRAQAANGELALTLGKIEKHLIVRKDPATDAKGRADAEAEIRRLIREFRVAYDKTGDIAFADLLGQYGMKGDDTAPTLDALPALRLIAGTLSAPKPLPVKDDRTALSALVIKAVVSGEKVTWTSSPSADGATVSYLVDADGTTVELSQEEKRNIQLSLQDHSENLTKAEQSLILVPLAPAFTPDPGAYKESTLTLPKDSRVTLALSVPLGDSAPEGWTVELTGTNNLDAAPARVPLNLSAPGQLGASVSLDASELKDSAGQSTDKAELTLVFRQGTRAIHTAKVAVVTQ